MDIGTHEPNRCSRCGDPSACLVRTRHFGLESVCDACAEALLQDEQTNEIPQPKAAG